MPSTSVSLLERLQDVSAEADWKRLVAIYEPFMRRILSQSGCQGSDVEDLIQESLTALIEALPGFKHNGNTGAFRRWLRQIVVNRLRRVTCHRHRSVSSDSWIDQLEDPAGELCQIWDNEHDSHVLSQLMELVRPHFAPSSWQAFVLIALDGRSAEETAAALGMSPNAVLIAKSRILQRLRAEAEGLVDNR